MIECIDDIASQIEALLFAAGDSVSAERIAAVIGTDLESVLMIAEKLASEYETNDRGIRIVRMDNRLQMCSAPEHADLIVRALEHRKPPMLSQPALETLAVVAYFQPVTRAYIDQIRGVDSSYTVNSLLERGLIEQTGRLEVPGRPALYSTTEVFLRTMNISTLSELPELPDVTTAEGIEELKAKIALLQNKEQTDQIVIPGLV